MAGISALWIEDRRTTGALGIGTPRPAVSWTARTGLQRAFELEWVVASERVVTGRIDGSASTAIAWPFAPLQSRTRGALRVRIWDVDDTPSEWSDAVHVEAGLLRRSDWETDFISPSPAHPSDSARPAYLLRAPFHINGAFQEARLYVSAHGVFELECNGLAVDDSVLAPGWTSYGHRLEYATIDVTSLLHEGDNALGAWLADGWYRGRLGFNGGLWDVYGKDVSLLAQLELHRADGTTERIPLQDQWRWSPSPITATGLYEGETFDSRLEPGEFSTAHYDSNDWHTPTRLTLSSFPAALVPISRPPIRRIETLHPQSIERRSNGRIRLDFGQNISGRLRLRVSGPAGHVIRLHHAEVLENDELAVRPLRTATSIDTFICDGLGPQHWEPRFTLHGFRYAEVEGWPDSVEADDVTAVVAHTEMRRTGWLETSDPMLNKLHENVVWSMRDNFVSIPTDCPQRDERLGWTGDIQVFAPTATFLYDVQEILNDWLRDLAVEQTEYGSVPNFVPWVKCGFPADASAAWGDAATVVPSVLYDQFGDLSALREQYPSMKAWVDQIGHLTDDDGLWTKGFQLGDWLDPAAPPTNPAASKTDKYLVASAYRIRSAQLLASAASLLGLENDSRHYEQLASAAMRSFQLQWVTPRGRISSDTVTAYALAISFGLLTPEQLPTAGARLVELVADSDFTITTGFVGTPLVCDALQLTGNTDAAYHLLMQRDFPSWLYPVTMGASTMWERWDSMLPDGSVNPGEMTSFNHYALGAVADFMHRTIGGLTGTGPGWSSIRVAPKPGGGLTWARTRHDSVHGTTSCFWERSGNSFHLELVVPAGVIAEVELPDGSLIPGVGEGLHSFTCSIRAAADDPTAPRTFNIHDPEARRAAEAGTAV